MERERAEKRDILFPIRIDDAVMSTHRAWAAAIRRMRHITDLSGSADPKNYAGALARLIRDLRRERFTMR